MDFRVSLEKSPYKDQVPGSSLKGLLNAIDSYKELAHPQASWNWKQDCLFRLQEGGLTPLSGLTKCQWALEKEKKGGKGLPSDMDLLNARIQLAERSFLEPQGLLGRPWYKHVVYAPDEWAGYRAEMFPTLRDALLTRGNVSQFEEALERLTTRIHLAAQALLPPPVY